MQLKTPKEEGSEGDVCSWDFLLFNNYNTKTRKVNETDYFQVCLMILVPQTIQARVESAAGM